MLKRVAAPVTDIGAEETALATDLMDTMLASPSCVGVAAPQIGVSIRAFSVNVEGHKKADSCHGAFVLFNPVLILARHLAQGREGCLSVPDFTAEVKRAQRILLRAWTPDEKEVAIEADGLLAVALQHELDHLDGKLFIDRLSRLKRDLYRARQRKLDRQGRPASSGRTTHVI